jgi:hypothetical protein
MVMLIFSAPQPVFLIDPLRVASWRERVLLFWDCEKKRTFSRKGTKAQSISS